MTDNLFRPVPPVINPQRDPRDEDTRMDSSFDKVVQQSCPACQKDHLVIDGCLNLTCPTCGFTQTGGGFT